MRDNERGAGGGEVIFIVALAAYFLFMGYIGLALDMTSPQIGELGSWTIPLLHLEESEGSWSWLLGGLLTVVDVLLVIINLLGWLLQMLVSYAVMIGFSVQGDYPAWISAFLFIPFGLGMGWLVLSLIRGRE